MSSSQKSVTLACKITKFNLTVFVSSTFRNVCPKTKQFWNSALCDVTKGTRTIICLFGVKKNQTCKITELYSNSSEKHL